MNVTPGIESETGTASTSHPSPQPIMSTNIARQTYERLGPQQMANIAGGALVLAGSFSPLFHAAGMFAAIGEFTSLTRLGFGGFLILIVGLMLAAAPGFKTLSRRSNLFAFGAATLCVGVILAINAITTAVGNASGGYAGAGPGVPILLSGFSLLAYIAFRRCENLEGLWGS